MTTRTWGLVSTIGSRESMEDNWKVVPALLEDNGGRQFDYFAVFDGHGGPQVADFCAHNMHKVLFDLLKKEIDSSELISDTKIKSLFTSCFEAVDSNLETMSIKEDVGSTALVALLTREKIVVGNCGDSRAVLSRGSEVVPLSTDHKPDRADERTRIEECGGIVITYCGCPRVYGVLATSRSLGDKGMRPWVIPTPEVLVLDRQPSDNFLILGTDGLWDVLSNEEAAALTTRVFERYDTSESSRAEIAARSLLKFARKRGTQDNTTIIVIDLKSQG